MRRLVLTTALLSSTAVAGPARLTLPQDAMNATVVVETDATEGRMADTMSIAPDLSVGVTDELTLSVVHSTFGRTGFRGSVGGGACITDTCAKGYDNVGLEGLYHLRAGAFAVAANAGVHATSLDRELYVGKLGAKLRYQTGRVTIASLPSITFGLSNREDNPERLWLPFTGAYLLGAGVSLGVAAGVKVPFEDAAERYETASGVFAQYVYSRAVAFGASWIHGRLFAGEAVEPSGMASRAINVWVSVTE